MRSRAYARLAIAEKVRVALHGIRVRDVEQKVTGSFGVATLLEDTLESDTMVRIADRALYSAKQHGRDRVEVPSERAEETV